MLELLTNQHFDWVCVLGVFEKLLTSSTGEELAASLRQAVGQLGFASFHFSSQGALSTAHPARGAGAGQPHFSGADQPSQLLISDYPQAWFQRYQAMGYLAIDPVVRHCAASILPALWHRRPASADSKVEQCFDEARQHGLAAGATCAVLERDGSSSIFSLVNSGDRASDRRHIEAHIHHGQMLMMHAHEVMKRLHGQAAGAPPIPQPVRLTVREHDCLCWVGRGKTSWEIAQILAVAERTVVFHIDNAVKKLDTRSRSQAVVKALTLGLIDF